MPYNRGPCVTLPTSTSASPSTPIVPTCENLHINSLLSNVMRCDNCGHTHLSNIPIRYGTFVTVPTSKLAQSHQLYNNEVAAYAFDTLQFSWAVYSFSSGHFHSTIESTNLTFAIQLACNVTESKRCLFGKFSPNAKVFSTSNDMLQHIREQATAHTSTDT